MTPRTRKTSLITAVTAAAVITAVIIILTNPFSGNSDPDGLPTNPDRTTPDTNVPTQTIPLRTGTITLTLTSDDDPADETVYQSTIQICDLHLDPPGIIATNPDHDPPIHIEISGATGNQLILVTNPDNPLTHTGDTTWTGTPQLDTTNTTATGTAQLTETTTGQTTTAHLDIDCPEL